MRLHVRDNLRKIDPFRTLKPSSGGALIQSDAAHDLGMTYCPDILSLPLLRFYSCERRISPIVREWRLATARYALQCK